MKTISKKLHIVMFPWLAFGHLMPFLEVYKSLAYKGHTIFFLSTPKNIDSLPNKQLLHPLIHLVKLPLPLVPDLPETAESTSDLPLSQIPYLKTAYDKMEPAVVDFLRRTKPDYVIHDFVPYWLPRAASRLGVHSVFFSIFGATVLAWLGPPKRLLKHNQTKPEDYTLVPDWITYTTILSYKLFEVLNLLEGMEPEVSDLVRFRATICGSRFIMVRSCPDLEPESLALLEKLYEQPVIPTGLLPPFQHQNDDILKQQKFQGLKEWLDDKEEKSVLYLALGSEIKLTQELMNELALGVEKSGLPYVVVLPRGFEEIRVSELGFLWKGWAPQLDILGHRSIGGFLTHCGWSSIIEGLVFGLPLILFSGGYSDQGLVARLLHEMQVGVEIDRDDKDGSFSSDAVCETIRRVMVDSKGETVRANAWAMQEICGNVDLQGKYLDKLAETLTQSIN